MYPSTSIEIVNQSQYQRISVAAINRAPTFLAAFAGDRGTEDLTLFTTSDSWHDMYGDDISFKKYGQAFKQAAMIVDNGGKLYSRRVVATDAKLPNLAIYAKVTIVTGTEGRTVLEIERTTDVWVEITDAKPSTVPNDGKQWSYNFTTSEWEQIDDTETAIDNTRTRTVDPVDPSVSVEYLSTYASNCTTSDMNDLVTAIENVVPANTDDGATSVTYLPLFAFATMGRGLYSPRIRITPSYRFSRSAGYAKCLIEIIGDESDTTESIYFALNPYKIEKGSSVSLDSLVNNNSSKIRVYQWEDNFDELYELVGSAIGYTEEEKKELLNGNLLFNTDLKGNRLITKKIRERNENETDSAYAQVPYLFNITNESGFDFQSSTGNQLQGGSLGNFGDKPVVETHRENETDPLTPFENYTKQLEKVFSEPSIASQVIGISVTDPNLIYNDDSVSVYNIDSVSINYILDANYPESVKNKIEEVVAWRNDTYFMRDMGLNIKNLSDVETYEANMPIHQYFTSVFHNSMMVLDDQTQKYIEVTIPYLIADKIVQHYLDGPGRPFAGIRYGIYWIYGSTIKKGSINFLPKVTPTIDEKEVLDDLGVNYVSILQGNKVVLETLYTAQHYNTTSQLSYSCNVWQIQKIIQVLREESPVARYAFATTDDLANYQADLLAKLDEFNSDFATFSISYAGDSAYEANKIYYAILEVSFKDFYQSEKFRIVALPTTATTSTSTTTEAQ